MYSYIRIRSPYFPRDYSGRGRRKRHTLPRLTMDEKASDNGDEALNNII